MPENITLNIPSIKDSHLDFNNLFKIYQTVENNLGPKSDVVRFFYDFGHCRTIYPNAIAFLYGLFRHIKSKNGEVFYVNGSLRKDIQSKLTQNGFLNRIEGEDFQTTDSFVLLREDKQKTIGTENSIIDYLKEKWLFRDWIHLSDLVKNAIAGQVWEIYDNSFSHALSPIGLFSCGQKIENKVKLAIIDFGRGIPLNVREYLNDKKMASSKTLKWAFKDGNTMSHTPDFGHSKNQTYFSSVFLEVFLWDLLVRSMTGRLSESLYS